MSRSLAGFVEAWEHEIGDAVLRAYPPLYDAEARRASPFDLRRLGRRPLGAQADAIRAVALSLQRQRGTILVGEMGVGKSTVAPAAAYLAETGGGFGFGPGGPERGGVGRGASFDAAAQAIGISTDQLRQELAGKSLAQVAQAHGKSASDVATALKNAANQRIDQEVSAGRLTADQATQRKQQESQRIDQLVNQVLPQGGPGGQGGSAARSARWGSP